MNLTVNALACLVLACTLPMLPSCSCNSQAAAAMPTPDLEHAHAAHEDLQEVSTAMVVEPQTMGLSEDQRRDPLAVSRHLLGESIANRTHAFDPTNPDWAAQARQQLWETLTLPPEGWGTHALRASQPETLELPRGTPEGLSVERMYYTASDGFINELYQVTPDCSVQHCTPMLMVPGHSSFGARSLVGLDFSSGDAYQYCSALKMALVGGYQVFVPQLRGMDGQDGGYTRAHLAMYRQYQAMGRELAGVYIDDVYHALRLTRELRVSNEPVIVAGASLGGRIAMMLGALEPSVEEVVVASHFGSYADTYSSGHSCSCNVMGQLSAHLELYEVAGLIAPRRLILFVGTTDRYLSLAEANRASLLLSDIYEELTPHASESNLRAGRWKGGHDWYTPLAIQLLNQ